MSQALKRFLFLCILTTTGCELTEVTVVDVEDLVVAEVYVVVAEDLNNNQVKAFLHGTGAGGVPSGRTFENAVVTVTRSDGLVLDFTQGTTADCIKTRPRGAQGTCFLGNSALTPHLGPGDELEVSIVLGNGGTLYGATTVPGDFQLNGVSASCRSEPNTLLPLSWSRSQGAWAYINETVISGLSYALAPEGIDADEEPLYLLGLSISAADTTVVFPSEFGIFQRGDLSNELTVRLQAGLPAGTDAQVSIGAADRNLVNWLRGGNFNPSGGVRVSSLAGDGLGVLGATLVREFEVISAGQGSIPLCPSV